MELANNFYVNLSSLALSEAFREKFNKYLSALDEVLADDDFRCIALYGNVLKDSFQEGADEIELLLIISDVNQKCLEKIYVPLQKAMFELKLSPMITTYEELLLSADAVPLKHLEIKKKYMVLCGEDLISGIEIPVESIRLYCERELRTISIKLRTDFVASFPDQNKLYSSLLQGVTKLLPALKLLIEIKIKTETENIKDALILGGKNFGFSPDSIIEIIRQQKSDQALDLEKVKSCYGQIIEIIKNLTNKADAI